MYDRKWGAEDRTNIFFIVERFGIERFGQNAQDSESVYLLIQNSTYW